MHNYIKLLCERVACFFCVCVLMRLLTCQPQCVHAISCNCKIPSPKIITAWKRKKYYEYGIKNYKKELRFHNVQNRAVSFVHSKNISFWDADAVITTCTPHFFGFNFLFLGCCKMHFMRWRQFQGKCFSFIHITCCNFVWFTWINRFYVCLIIHFTFSI